MDTVPTRRLMNGLLKSLAVFLLDRVLLFLLIYTSYSQSYDFSSSYVWMWELDYKQGWAPKNWCFWLRCWRRFLRVLWTARRPNQSILKEISPEYSLEGLRLKLKFQYFGHLMRRANSLAKTLRPWCWERLKAEGDERGRDGWMASPIQCTWVWASSERWWRTRKPGVLQSMGLQRVGHDWATKQQQQHVIINENSNKIKRY